MRQQAILTRILEQLGDDCSAEPHKRSDEATQPSSSGSQKFRNEEPVTEERRKRR